MLQQNVGFGCQTRAHNSGREVEEGAKLGYLTLEDKVSDVLSGDGSGEAIDHEALFVAERQVGTGETPIDLLFRLKQRRFLEIG